jgi:signal peptidase I
VGTTADSKKRTDRDAFCPNCGCTDLDLEGCATVAGDHLLVNKTAFEWRRPRRWEMIVFRCPADPSRAFVKRVVGLPGEEVQVHDGDIYIDHELARKTLPELKVVRIPVFDYNFPPQPDGWRGRWEIDERGTIEERSLSLDTHATADKYHWLVYRPLQPSRQKARAIYNEYSYNGSAPARGLEPVHDFQMECDLEVRGGEGWIALGITDGAENLQVDLPVGDLKGGTRLGEADQEKGHLARTFRPAPLFGLQAGKTYRVELAFVDRRVTLTVNGEYPLVPVDRPAISWRGEVARPVRIGARGVEVRVHNFRLFRDVHYTEACRHAIHSPVRLGAGEYFVLGDNSPNSDDNRFWSGAEGQPLPVPEANLIGKPFLVHMPSRIVHWDILGCQWDSQGLDWDRVHWVR